MKLKPFTSGNYLGNFPCANDVTQDVFDGVSAEQVEEYVQTLIADGYTVSEDHTRVNNRFVTFTCPDGVVHLTYTAYDQKFRVISDPLTQFTYKKDEPAYEKITDVSLAVMARDYSVQANRDDGNGLSYVITLEDGRYIIFDGGYRDCGDDDALYNYMKANNKRADGRIVIAAWIFTHSHKDHVGAFIEFSHTYADRVTVDYLVANTGTEVMYRPEVHGTFLEQELIEYRNQYYPNAKMLKPHTGQTLTFCNTTFDVLYTQEIMAPDVMPWENDSSLVLRMNFCGKTIIFMADCQSGSTDIICQMYGEQLKSYALQVNHHGHSGATTHLFDLVAPTYALWTTSYDAFEKRITGVKYQFVAVEGTITNPYIFNMVGREHCIVADGPIKIITVQNGEFCFEETQVDFEKHI